MVPGLETGEKGQISPCPVGDLGPRKKQSLMGERVCPSLSLELTKVQWAISILFTEGRYRQTHKRADGNVQEPDNDEPGCHMPGSGMT